MKIRVFVAALMLLAAPVSADPQVADAKMANIQLSDPVKEQRAKTLMETIRCVMCQSQSIADSDAKVAGDMRSLIRQRIDQGESPESVRAWLIERYGSYITYDPPLSTITSPIWVFPILFFVLGIILIRGRLKVRRK